MLIVSAAVKVYLNIVLFIHRHIAEARDPLLVKVLHVMYIHYVIKPFTVLIYPATAILLKLVHFMPRVLSCCPL